MRRGQRTPSSRLLPRLPADAAHAGAGGQPTEWQFFDHYCGKCHNSTDWAGGVAFDTMQPEGLYDDAQVFGKSPCASCAAASMPPPDKPQPSQGEIDKQVAWLEGKLDDQAKTHPNPGNVVVHRLNRTEYQREIKNLLDLDIDAATLLPKDTKADGFDNVAHRAEGVSVVPRRLHRRRQRSESACDG